MPAKVPDGALIWDGFSQVSGMNNGSDAQQLAPFQAALMINATARGSLVTQRPGFRRIMTVLQEPPGMFQHFSDFRTDAGRQFLMAVVGGRIYRIDPIEKTTLEVTIPGDANPFTFERGWSVQAETFWIYNDGQTRPFIFNGGSARRATDKEIGPGTVITYVQGRLWYALPDGLGFRATDLVGNTDSGTPAYDYRDSILRETENDYLNEGGDFRVPFNCGEITAMAATSNLDTSQGQGPLQVLCQRNGFTVNTPVNRDIWKSVTYPIQTESLIGAGCSGMQGTVNVNGDLFFRAPDGIRSFIIARRQFRDWGNTPQSWEVSGLLNFDQPDLLTFGSGAVIDNRYLTTLSPAWSKEGVYHRGLAVVDLAPITSIQATAAPVYDGLWTGLNILGVRQTVEGTFMLTLAEDKSIELWRITTDEQFDDGDGRIQWTVVPRTMFIDRDVAGRPGRKLKRLETADFEYDRITGLADFKLSWSPDAYPCPTVWKEWQECVQDCFTNIDCTGNLVFQTGYQPRKRVSDPPDTCAIGAKRPLRNFYTLVPRIDITGPARLLSARFGASVCDEPKFEANVCDDLNCVPLQCCGPDPFGYVSKGSQGGGSGSGSGSGSGGGNDENPTDIGACCISGACSVTTRASCATQGGTFLGKDTTCTEGACGSVPPFPGLPAWPVPDPYPCEGRSVTTPILVTDPVTNLDNYVGIAPGAYDPISYLAAFGQPGCLEAWAAEVWSQFVATATPYSQARLIWQDVHTTGKNFMAISVFPDQAGGYPLVIDLDTKIVVEYCLTT